MKNMLNKDLIYSEMRYWQVPGLSISYVKDDKSYSYGFGFRDKEKNPVDENTVFCIASCSKAMTSAIAAILVSEGLIDYDVPVQQYVPHFRMADKDAEKKVTLRDMLCHRTGIAPHDGIWPDTISSADLCERAAGLSFSAPFRSKAQYSNVIYAVAGYIMEKVTGLTWPQIMQKYLFSPLGMSSTSCDTASLIHSRNHAEPFQIMDGRLTQLDIWNVDSVAPAASVNTTAVDMCKWLSFLVSKGKSPNGKQLITPSVFEEMITKQIDFTDFIEDPQLFPLDGYALGWQTGLYRGKHILRHTGKIEGYSAVHTFIPEEGIGVSLMLNFHSPTISFMFSIMYDILDRLLGVHSPLSTYRFHDNQPPEPQIFNDCYEDLFKKRYPDAIPLHPQTDMSQYVGIYKNPGYGCIEILIKDCRLYLKSRGRKSPLLPYWGELFKVIGFKEDIITYDLPVSFIRDHHKTIRALSIPCEPLTADIIFQK